MLGVVVLGGAILAINALLVPAESKAHAEKGRLIIGNARNLKNAEEKAFKVTLPGKGWIVDNEIRQRLGAITALKSTDKDGWFTVAVRDYGLTRPREAELLATGIDKLEQCFEGNLELAEKARDQTVLGLPEQAAARD